MTSLDAVSSAKRRGTQPRDRNTRLEAEWPRGHWRPTWRPRLDGRQCLSAPPVQWQRSGGGTKRTASMVAKVAAMTEKVRRFSSTAVLKSESKSTNATSTRLISALSMTQCRDGSCDAAMPPRRELACMHEHGMRDAAALRTNGAVAQPHGGVARRVQPGHTHAWPRLFAEHGFSAGGWEGKRPRTLAI